MSASKHLALSVKDLVEFSAQSGDLYYRQHGPTKEEGILAHQEVQKSRGDGWQKEVYVKHEFHLHHYDLSLQGRADLIYHDGKNIIVEEIKTTYYPPEELPEAKKRLHFAQAKVYAYLYARHLPEELSVELRLTWYDIRARRAFCDAQTCCVSELASFTYTLLDIYTQWMWALDKSHEKARLACRALDFPFAEFRPQQRNFSGLVYRAIRDKTNLLIEAPTGSGKTMATIFPSIKAFGDGLVHQVCYLTLKNSASAVAENTLSLISEKNLPITYIRLQAKDKTCPCRKPNASANCFNSEGLCQRTIGYFDRLPAARLEALACGRLDNDALQKIAAQHRLCPFELALEMARWASVVVCDVNYFFDPLIRLGFFDRHGQSRALLIDEIHNLIDRGRQMFSAQLDSHELSQLRQHVSAHSKNIPRALDTLINRINHFAAADCHLDALPKEIERAVEYFIDQREQDKLASMDANESASEPAPAIIKCLFALYKFQLITELYSPAHTVIYERTTKGARIKLFCRDPAIFLAKAFSLSRSNIVFSATLTPIDYFQKTLGLTHNSKAYALPPAFPPERQLSLRCDYIDTRWKARDRSLDQLVELINIVQTAKPGNYLVFLPSYTYLEALKDHFCARYPHALTVSQERGADEDSQRAFISAFMSREEPQQHTPLLGFAILGGIFGEGVDFSGDALSGAIVVGLGMPQPGHEQRLMEDYYKQQGCNSFHYVYQFPGLVRVLQTCGRVIRSEKDKGVVILVDPRLKQKTFSELLPKHWRIAPVSSPQQVEELTHAFWHQPTKN